MAIFKCKMCGGSLEINNETVATCEYCGTQQTLPKLHDDRLVNLHDRASHFRRNNEFDKAMSIYEQILNENSTDAEVYWSLVLCRYGIEYVEDPATHKRIPTVNRAQFTSVYDDDNYKSALQYADGSQKVIYETEAKAINEIQKGILAISQKEEPFDVFICYKETDHSGRRTPDSVLANELYHQLTQEGFKVFFSRITLEDKLGVAYEPYIFAALNSAKVMVVLGTKPEYFNAVWVKNEWSRYLGLIKNGAKKILIPAYKDMDPYDLPEEFSHLQAQDMSRLGFMQDLIRGIKKIAQEDAPKTTVVKEMVISGNAAGAGNIDPLLKRAFMFLEDGDWNSANEYCEKVLDIDPECAQAYLGKLMAELRVKKQNQLPDQAEPFDGKNNYQKALRFADPQLAEALKGYIVHINTRNENARLEGIYKNAKDLLKTAEINTVGRENNYRKAAQLFESVSEYLDSKTLAQDCREKAENTKKDTIYSEAKAKMSGDRIADYEDAIKRFHQIPGWKDADAKVDECKKKIKELTTLAEAARLERERKAEIARKEAARIAKRNKKIAIITTPIVCAVVAFIFILVNVIIPNIKYNKATALMEAGKYEEAIAAFEALDEYKDSSAQIQNCHTAILDDRYDAAIALKDGEKYEEAIAAFEALDGYKDSSTQIQNCRTAILDDRYDAAIALMDAEKYEDAIAAFEALDGYKDSSTQIQNCRTAILDDRYDAAIALMDAEKYEDAIVAFEALGGHRDSNDKKKSCVLSLAQIYEDGGQYDKAIQWYETISDQDNIHRLMYTYVMNHKNKDDVKTYEYLKILYVANYKDAVSVYKSLYKINIKVFFNTDRDDHFTSMQTIYNRTSQGYKNAYCHYKVTGGPPVAEFELRFVHETRWGYDNVATKPYEVESDANVKVTADGECEHLYLDNGSNLYYHRVTVYDTFTGEQLTQVVLYNPYD